MKTAIAGAAFLAVLMLAHVVAAGVVAVLGPIALELEDEGAQLAAVAVVAVLALGCGLAFLKGCLRFLIDQLQSPPARRGG